MTHPGQMIREAYLWHPMSQRTIVVAVDHGLFMGPIPGARDLGALLPLLATGGADAIQLSPGQAAAHVQTFSGKGAPALVVRLDACNLWRQRVAAPQPGYWAPVASPRRAAQLGAHVAVCFLFYGWDEDPLEAANLAQVGQWAEECADLGLPLMVEPLPVGSRVANENDTEWVALGVRMAVEAGASLIKANYTGQADTFREITASSPVPILARGGPKAATEAEYTAQAAEIVQAGGRGLVVGRNVFQSNSPAETLRTLAGVVHGRASAAD